MWKIVVKENQNKSIIDAAFEVKKYILSKFEVTLDHFKKVRIDEEKINVTVCAK